MKKYNREDKNSMIDYRLNHIRMVQDNMFLLEKNLDKLPFKLNDFEIARRAMQHDVDKFSDDLAEGFIEIEKNYKNRKTNPELYQENEKKLRPIRVKHWENNPHHAIYHLKNNTTFSNLDVCELCCDLDAVSQIMDDDPKEYYLNKQFKEHPELYKDQNENILKVFDLLKELKKKLRNNS
ncbi:MAG: hypothetical protein GX638_07800 [Crenarchaeota archaeon]|nr:hypothetical protein [Thermoproteota archaeon]